MLLALCNFPCYLSSWTDGLTIVYPALILLNTTANYPASLCLFVYNLGPSLSLASVYVTVQSGQ